VARWRLTPALLTAVPAEAATASVALVGDLQSEVGCPDDWDPACTQSELSRVGDTDIYKGTFEVPEGDFKFKVALNDGWDENYGAGGTFNGDNIPLLLAGPASIEFTFDDATNIVTFAPADLDEDTTSADAALAEDSLRSALTRERFYFVMADRFANGSTENDLGGLTGGPLTTGYDPNALTRVLHNMESEGGHGGMFATHPAPQDRISSLGATMPFTADATSAAARQKRYATSVKS